ncbi:hypothetical protein DD563_02310 [Pelagicola sp. LXJ1103]|nr:hypothetical protein DD563_02310 [Pelagicola sp. LXJ1103]
MQAGCTGIYPSGDCAFKGGVFQGVIIVGQSEKVTFGQEYHEYIKRGAGAAPDPKAARPSVAQPFLATSALIARPHAS